MSLFGHFGFDDENDPFFGNHFRQMNNFMSSVMGDPFGMMSSMSYGGFPAIGNSLMSAPGQRRQPVAGPMMPFGFPNMNNMLQNFDQLGNNGNCHMFSQNTVMTMSSGPDGRPQVYQASSSTRTAPGGVKETKKTLCDSRTGTKKMSIGHHIGERAHILEQEQNILSGERDERQDFINLEEEEADSFNREFEQKVRHYGAVGGRALTAGGAGRAPRHRDLLALPPSSGRIRGRDVRRNYPAIASSSKIVELAEDSGHAKKRDHEAEPNVQGRKMKMMRRSPVVIDDSESDGGHSDDASKNGDS